jgi:hypothetical protein
MMHRRPPDLNEFNPLKEQSGYARSISEFGETEVSDDHIGNLEKMITMLVHRRRFLAQEAMAYNMTFLGRSYDIAKIQPIIEAMEAALAHERSLARQAE